MKCLHFWRSRLGKTTTVSILFLVNSWVIFSHPKALASFENYNSILIGDQAAGMGGAYTAMSEDASALPWYNPAALSFLNGQRFSAAVGIYKKFDTVFDSNQDITKAPLRVNQGFFHALPSSTGSVFRPKEVLSESTLAFSILVPDYNLFKGDISHSDSNTSTLSVIDESLWVGGAWSKKTSVDESWGVSAYYTARSYSRTVNDRTVEGSRRVIYNEEKNLSQNSIVFIGGYLRQLSDKWKMGASVRLPSIFVAGRGSFFNSYVDTNSTDNPSIRLNSIPSRGRIPGRYTVGFAYQALDVFVLTTDVSYYGVERNRDLDNESVAENLEHKNIWNFALGGELELRDWLKLRAGGFTNFSSRPDPQLEGTARDQGDRVDQLGFSANMAFITGPMQYTFGGYYTGGKGRSIQRVNQTYQVLPKSVNVFTMLVGSSYSF